MDCLMSLPNIDRRLTHNGHHAHGFIMELRGVSIGGQHEDYSFLDLWPYRVLLACYLRQVSATLFEIRLQVSYLHSVCSFEQIYSLSHCA